MDKLHEQGTKFFKHYRHLLYQSNLHVDECPVFSSTKDTKWVSQVFRRNKWKAGSKLFDLEKDDGFRMLIPQRDFIIGGRTADDMENGMRKSRRVIFIISR